MNSTSAESTRAPHRRASRRRDRRGRLQSFYGLTALSTLLPGAGLLATRRRRVGAAVLGLFVVATAAVMVKAGAEGVLHMALRLALSRSALLVILALIVVATVIWCGAIVLTAVTTSPRPLPGPDRLPTRLFTAAACALIVLPAGFAMRDIAIQRSLIGTLFRPGSTHSVIGPDASRPDPWKDLPRVNVLLLGSDAGPDRTGVRTDSMMVASIDTQTGDTVLFGIPRNLQNVPFPASNPLHKLYPNGYNCGSPCLLNAVWTLAGQHADLFPGNPNPGLSSTRDAISEVLGLSINYTTVIDLSGFESLVDAMGGVDVNVLERVPIGGKVVNGQVVEIKGWIDPGYQHLDGYHALWYARSRATTDDFSRMRRQRCVAGALVDQVNPVAMLQRYPALAKVAKNNITVDIPQDDLPAWVTLVERIKSGTIRSLPLTNNNVDVTNPDFAKIHALVQSALVAKPKTQPKPSTSSPSPSSTSSHSTAATTPTPGASTTPQPTDTLTNVKDSC